MKQGKYRIHGLSAPRSFTLRNKFGSWWAVSELAIDRYNALFDWIKKDNGFWKDHEVWGTINHTGLSSDGTPMNGRVIDIDIVDIPKIAQA
jgi:hypothetical protein